MKWLAPTVLACVGLLLGDQAHAQRRNHDVFMKEIGATTASLRTAITAGNAQAIAAEADTLERLFGETEAFWTPFKTKDAIDAAKGARDLSRTIAAAARANDLPKAREAGGGLGRFCTACHNSHREQMPDKSYRIKP